MSETPTYFLLAQLFTLMTVSLRLALAFLLLAVGLALGGLFRWPRLELSALARYLLGWSGCLGGAGLSAALAESSLLTYPNPFVQQGIWLGGGLALGCVLLLLVSARWRQRALLPGVLLPAVLLCLQLPAFSRSNQTLLSTLFALPSALVLGYFCLFLQPETFPSRSVRDLFHRLWALASILVLGLYLGWLYPQIAGLPPEGEFYPFLSLYDWFLAVFMILYSGNLYIDYWLKNEERRLFLIWNYLSMVAALVCVWFNASIFDTLAL
jgi:hypothetical protein